MTCHFMNKLALITIHSLISILESHCQHSNLTKHIYYAFLKKFKSGKELIPERTIYIHCKAHSWSWFNFNFICIRICWLHATKTGRFLRVWNTSRPAQSADVVNIILLLIEKGTRIHSSFLSSSMGGKGKKREKWRKSICGPNFGISYIKQKDQKMEIYFFDCNSLHVEAESKAMVETKAGVSVHLLRWWRVGMWFTSARTDSGTVEELVSQRPAHCVRWNTSWSSSGASTWDTRGGAKRQGNSCIFSKPLELCVSLLQKLGLTITNNVEIIKYACHIWMAVKTLGCMVLQKSFNSIFSICFLKKM